ncbi:MAG: hypothetical protein ACRECY_12340 [Phyllobacterium sp.]
MPARYAIWTEAGVGCMSDDDAPTDRRRFYHHMTFYSFVLYFLSTTTATGCHYPLGIETPYPWYDAGGSRHAQRSVWW